MLRNMVRLTLYLSLICCVLQVYAEQPAASGIVPPVVKFGGVLTDASGKPAHRHRRSYFRSLQGSRGRRAALDGNPKCPA